MLKNSILIIFGVAVVVMIILAEGNREAEIKNKTAIEFHRVMNDANGLYWSDRHKTIKGVRRPPK